jgi:asparagine synthase (glutamine-hydrolysing)
MCGIAGAVDYANRPDKINIYEKMSLAMKERGPDADGMYFSPHAVLIHRRLAIVDVEHSKQPMTFDIAGKKYTIVYNGELYNTEDLKNELKKEGFSFTTSGDTEVVLKSYICWGEECLSKFNGIFAFAVLTEDEEKLFFARDCMGVKPFFYSTPHGSFVFASSVPALLCHDEISHKIDLSSICEVMLIGPGRTPGNAVFPDISELPRGFCGSFSKDGLETHEYFSLTDSPHTDSFEDTLSNVRSLVFDAIERQMISDVPIGTFLSGGLDSSIISAVVAEKMREQGKTLDTFSVFYRDNEKYFKPTHFQPNSDDYYIDVMVKKLKSNHHEVVLDTNDLIDALYAAIDVKALPSMADVDSSLLAFCKEIKKHVSVALSGECADEIFGGYPWYRDADIRDREGFPWAQSTSYRAEFLTDEILEKIDPQKYVQDKYDHAKALADKNPSLSPLESRRREMMRLNLDWFMQTLLMRKDAMSMYSSLEVRVPFCDKRITKYLYSVPWEYKDYMGREKGLLRLAVEDILPEEIVWRKKSPYPKTHNPSYLSALRDILSSLLSDSSSPLWQFVNCEKASTLLSEERSIPWYGQLMTTPQTIAYLIQTNYWLKKFDIQVTI